METPLYGYDSVDNSYLVESYPYGNKRCRIRFWLEYKESKGFRFCSQTEHPVKKIWNAPKKGVYFFGAACMYLDEKGHCTWSSVGDDPVRAIEFVKRFPKADLTDLLALAVHRKVMATRTMNGQANFRLNNVPQMPSDADKEQAEREVKLWSEFIDLAKKAKVER